MANAATREDPHADLKQFLSGDFRSPLIIQLCVERVVDAILHQDVAALRLLLTKMEHELIIHKTKIKYGSILTLSEIIGETLHRLNPPVPDTLLEALAHFHNGQRIEYADMEILLSRGYVRRRQFGKRIFYQITPRGREMLATQSQRRSVD